MRHSLADEDLADIAAAPLPFEKLAGARILVTGAAGFLASHLIEALLYLNETRGLRLEVLALARNRKRAEVAFAAHAGRADLKLAALAA